MRLAPPAILACALCALGLGAPAAQAKVTATFADRVLTAHGSKGADRVRVVCSPSGHAKVNGKNPKGGRVPCLRVVEVNAQTGPGNDLVDLSRVDGSFGEAKFPGFGTGTGAAAVLGAGNDRYIPSPGAFNLVFGEAGKDRIDGGSVRDILSGGGGNDRIRGFGGRDTLLGNAGNDTLRGHKGADLLSGNAGNDRLFGGPGGDVLGGGRGNDRLFGGPGKDRLLGGPGRDFLRGGPGRDAEIQNPPKKKKK